jgi:hypothetical protein
LSLWTIFVILPVLWLPGMVSTYTPVAYLRCWSAIVVALIQLIQGRRVVEVGGDRRFCSSSWESRASRSAGSRSRTRRR